MTGGHGRHLATSLRAITDVARQMERAGRDGRSPTGTQALTPLAPTDWVAMADSLARMQARLQETIRRLAPEQLAERNTAENRAATLYWLSLLLLRLDEEIIDALDPAHTEPKFGALNAEERAELSGLVEELHSEAVAMRAQIETLRGTGV